MIIAPATSFKSRIKRIAELSTTVPNKMFARATDPNVLTSEELSTSFQVILSKWSKGEES